MTAGTLYSALQKRFRPRVFAMTQQLGSYSDWRTIAPVDRCPRCGGTYMQSRDCPIGLEVACAGSCGYHEVLAHFSREDFDRWMQRVRLQRRS